MAKFITSREAQARIAELEALVEKGSPITNAAPDPASRARVADAVQAKLDAAKASAAAVAARAKSQALTSAIKPAGTITAAEWQAQHAAPRMSREEWSKLDHLERGKFFQTGGKLA